MSINVGNEICIAGYIMDSYCIERGTLLDNPRIKTLGPDGPLKHSVHCLVDVPSCYLSPFEVLIPIEKNATNSWGRAWRVDDNSAILEHARSIGKCSTCTNTATDAISSGYRITIKGKVKDLGTEDVPPTISVSSIGDYDNFESICDGTLFESPNMIGSESSNGDDTSMSEEPSLSPSKMEEDNETTSGDTGDNSNNVQPSAAPSMSTKSMETTSTSMSEEPSLSPSKMEEDNETTSGDMGNNSNNVQPSAAPSMSTKSLEPSSTSMSEDPSTSPSKIEESATSASAIFGIGSLGVGCLLLIPVMLLSMMV